MVPLLPAHCSHLPPYRCSYCLLQAGFAWLQTRSATVTACLPAAAAAAASQGGHEWHQQWQPCQQQLPTSGRLALPLQLHNPSRSDRVEGQLELEVRLSSQLQQGRRALGLGMGPIHDRAAVQAAGGDFT